MGDCGRKQDMLFDKRGSALGRKIGLQTLGFASGYRKLQG